MAEQEVRLIQIFLSGEIDSHIFGVFEVSADSKRNLFCTCPGYVAKSLCKHTRVVKDRIESNSGAYPFRWTKKLSTEDIIDAMNDVSEFRSLMLKYSKIDVL